MAKSSKKPARRNAPAKSSRREEPARGSRNAPARNSRQAPPRSSGGGRGNSRNAPRGNSRGNQREDYDNTDRGVLFKNNRKNSDKSPDLSGNINIGGEEFWLSAWTQRPRGGGDNFLVLRVTPKDDADPHNDGYEDRNDRQREDDLPF